MKYNHAYITQICNAASIEYKVITITNISAILLGLGCLVDAFNIILTGVWWVHNTIILS